MLQITREIVLLQRNLNINEKSCFTGSLERSLLQKEVSRVVWYQPRRHEWHIRASFIDLFFPPLFQTPNASRAILTSQTSQYSNTAVTGPPAANPTCWSLLRIHKPSLPVGCAEGNRGGGETHKHRNIDTFTQPKNITHAMRFKANVILKQTGDVCPVSGGPKGVNGKVKKTEGWSSVLYWPLLELCGKASRAGATINCLVLSGCCVAFNGRTSKNTDTHADPAWSGVAPKWRQFIRGTTEYWPTVRLMWFVGLNRKKKKKPLSFNLVSQFFKDTHNNNVIITLTTLKYSRQRRPVTDGGVRGNSRAVISLQVAHSWVWECWMSSRRGSPHRGTVQRRRRFLNTRTCPERPGRLPVEKTKGERWAKR